MATEKIGQSFSQRGMKAGPEKMPPPPSPKEAPKDNSIFGGSNVAKKYDVGYGRFRNKFFDATHLTDARRNELLNKVFKRDSFTKSDLDNAKRGLASGGRVGNYDKPSGQDKIDLKRLFGAM